MLLPGSALANSFSATEEVTEDYGDAGVDLAFTVTNDGYEDIVEFAIGNPEGEIAWTDNSFNGVMAYKDEDGHWTGGGDDRDLDWMDNATNFAGYDRAFLFTTWVEGEEGGFFTGYLELGTTYGYFGTTAGPCSPVAAYSESEGTINGGEAQPVPIPGALWLLGSGLIGLAGFRRRK
jgi:hypothetical protein